MNATFKGDVHLQNDDSSNSDYEDVEVDNFEEEAAVEDTIPEEPCVERVLEEIMMIIKLNVILHLHIYSNLSKLLFTCMMHHSTYIKSS